jgi:hypothetical protein
MSQLSDAIGEELKSFKPFIVDQAKSKVEDGSKAGLTGCLEEGKLETIRIVGVVETENLRETFPHPNTVRKGPY